MPELTVRSRQLVQVMQLLGDETRFKMFVLLMEHAEYCVTEIAWAIGVTPSAVSQHFRQLELVDLVRKVRKGKKICYEVNQSSEMASLVKELIKERQ